MGTKQSCISPTGTEPRNTARTNVNHSSPSPVNEKMGTKQSCISPTGTEPRNTARTNVNHSSPSPVNEKMGTKQSYKFTKPKVEPNDTAKTSPVQSQQVRDPVFPTGSNFQVSPKTDGEVKRSKSIGRHMVVHKFDGKNEDVSRGQQERPVARSTTSMFETPCPRPGNEDPRKMAPVKAWTEDLSGSENKHAFLTNEDQKKKSNRMENTTFSPVETRDAGDIKTAERNEKHDASSTNNMNTVYVHERNVKRLEPRAGQFSAENDGLINRDADDIKTAESNENHATSSSNDMNRDHEYERKVKRLEARVSQLNADKDGLLNRLSEVGAIKLTEHNPNVTDLSDPNRPEKVVEELSEIYDNEWTDAYEHLTKTRKENTVDCAKKLLEILQDVFNICMSSTEKKTKVLRKAITKYVGLTKEDQDEIDLKDIVKRIREYRRKKMQNNFKSLEQEVGKQLKKNRTKETFDDLSEYIGSCVRICWKLCTKEPPMHLDFGDSKQPAQSSHKTATKKHFDSAIFRCYTKSGNYIDYVVWPAVYLYKDGPLMRKGVAQGIQEDEEYKDEQDKPA